MWPQERLEGRVSAHTESEKGWQLGVGLEPWRGSGRAACVWLVFGLVLVDFNVYIYGVAYIYGVELVT